MSPRQPVTHINLLESKLPALSVGVLLTAVLAVTLLGLLAYGRSVVPAALAATERSDALAVQIKAAQAKLAAAAAEKARDGRAVALRQEVDQLQPQALAAKALVAAVRAAEGGNADDFGRALTAATSVNEPGLWLTSVSLSQAGKQLELQGQAGGGAAVLRFAKRANDQLQALTLRLDSLEINPGAASTAAAPAGGAAPAAPQGVSFKLN